MKSEKALLTVERPKLASLTTARLCQAIRVLAHIPRSLQLVWKAHVGYTILLVVLTIILGIIPLTQAWITKLIIDDVMNMLRIAPPAIALHHSATVGKSSNTLSSVLELVVILGLVSIVNQALAPALQFVQAELTDHFAREIDTRIINKANSLVDISLFENPKFYDLLQKAQSEASSRPVAMLSALAVLLRSVIGLCSMLGVLLAFQPLFALIVVGISLPSLIVQFRHQRQSWSVRNQQVPEVRRMRYFSTLLTSNFSAKEVRLFGLSNYFLNYYQKKFDEFHREHFILRRHQLGWNILLSVFASVAAALFYAYIIFQTLSNRITLGSLSLYTYAVAQVQLTLSVIVSQVGMLYEGALFVDHLFEFLNIPPIMTLPPPSCSCAVPVPLQCGITFRHVNFHYPNSDRYILKDINFTILPGQTVALVGANGAGKTTLIKLLTRLYDPTGGSIEVDGVDLRKYDLDSWRKQVGVIFQDFSQYHMLVRENIGLGQVDHINDLDTITTAAARAGATAMISRLPRKFETPLGRWLLDQDEGVNLSGGEWQKIALARAFMRGGNSHGLSSSIEDAQCLQSDGFSDVSASLSTKGGGAQLLILDEPTAALDAQAEADIYQSFHELTQGKSTLLISHRFSTVKMADVIILLKDGCVSECGSHTELFALGGEYARLYNLQAERYQ